MDFIMNVQCKVNAQFCKGCGFCVRFCPEKALAMGKQRNKKGDYLPDLDKTRCTGCATCARMCPEGAISIGGEVHAA